jgi:hypothetical protein
MTDDAIELVHPYQNSGWFLFVESVVRQPLTHQPELFCESGFYVRTCVGDVIGLKCEKVNDTLPRCPALLTPSNLYLLVEILLPVGIF